MNRDVSSWMNAWGNHNDQRDTVSYTLIGNALTQPEDKHTSCGQDNDGRNHEHRPGDALCEGSTSLHLQVHQVTRSLEQQDSHCQPTGVHGDFLTAALTLTLHLLYVRHSDGEELHDNRSRDVRHDSKRKDRCVGECATREHIEQRHQTAGSL